MDHLADKLMCLTVLLSLVSSGTVQWIPVVLIMAIELFMLAGGTYLLGKGVVVQSHMIGKESQWLLITALCMGFFHDIFCKLDIAFRCDIAMDGCNSVSPGTDILCRQCL